MKIPITLIQIKDGFVYEGTIQFENRKYDWKITFGESAEKILKKEAVCSSSEDVFRIFGIELRYENQKVDLTGEMYLFLVGTIMTYTLDFYQNPQTRDLNAGSIQFFISEYSEVGSRFSKEGSFEIPEEDIPKEFIS